MISRASALASVALVALVASEARGQPVDVGHKILGTIGVRAGAQIDPGLYVADRLLWYSSNDLRDRNGDPIDVGLDLDALSNVLGAVAVFELPGRIYFNASVAAPVTRVWASTDLPEASTDRFGFGDLYLQPAKLGWRGARWDVVVGYGLYIPTGVFEPRGGSGVGRGHWTHEVAAGGTAYFDESKTWSLSALGSWNRNSKKRGIDITRGDSVQVQGGLGKVLGAFEPGLTGYALWQVTDDQGADLPAALHCARDFAVGVGAQLGVSIPSIRSRLGLSYSHDLWVHTRPLGQLLLLSFTVNAFKPATE